MNKTKPQKNKIIEKLPNKKYQIIYADPPWHFGDKVKSNSSKGAHFYSLKDKHYKTMSQKDIINLPVQNITDENCILFMWSTHAHIEAAIQVGNQWGFKYITIGFEWFKSLKRDIPATTLGKWTVGGSIELCLLFKKGHPKRVNKKVRRLLFSRRTQHSKKPDEVRNSIVRLMGDLPRIELFAREHIQGWDVWGNEAPKDITSFECYKNKKKKALFDL